MKFFCLVEQNYVSKLQHKSLIMNIRRKTRNKTGFTLIEVIAVLVLLSILVAVAVPKFVDITTTGRERAVDAAIAELNSREDLEWSRSQLGPQGWTSDVVPDLDLGVHYDTSNLSATGGNIIFQSITTVTLTRSASTNESPAIWTD